MTPTVAHVHRSALRAMVMAALATTLTLGGAAGQVAPGSLSPEAPPGSPAAITPLKVGLGYIPSVQFAQFYLADQAGYYRDAGLTVTFQHHDDATLVTLLAQGGLDIGLVDGTSVIPAVSREIPIRYVATVYARFPVVVYVKASSGITSVADLSGVRLGIPATSGSSWIMLQALLVSAGLTPNDLEIDLYPRYGQEVALAADRVEAATGYANNEPVQLARKGIDLVVFRVDDVTPLPGPGLAVGEGTLKSKPEALRAFVAATLRAMEEIIADPQKGLDAAFARVPELADDPEGQRAVLDATIEAWTSDYTAAHGLGAIDPAAWEASVAAMAAMPDSVVERPVSVDQLITSELLP